MRISATPGAAPRGGIRERRRISAPLVVPVLTLLALAAAACHGKSESDDRTVEPVARVRTARVELREFAAVVRAPGRWRTTGEVLLLAPFAGTIETLSLRIGDRVTAGQVVGRLVTRESQGALRGAEILRQQAATPADQREADRALELARRDVVRVPITAPADGMVVRREVDAGSLVGESGEIAALVPRNGIVFEARVQPAEAPHVRTGQPATVVDLDGPVARACRVERILPAGDAADQTALLWIRPSGGPEPLLERFGTADIEVGPPHRAPAVPDSALSQDDLTGRLRLLVVTPGGRAVWTDVTAGAGASGWREIRSPALEQGTLVVIEGQHGLPDSTRVTVAP